MNCHLPETLASGEPFRTTAGKYRLHEQLNTNMSIKLKVHCCCCYLMLLSACFPLHLPCSSFLAKPSSIPQPRKPSPPRAAHCSVSEIWLFCDVSATERSPLSSPACPVVRYRGVITEQLMRAFGTSCQPVWRQSKEMLKEEGIEIAAADSSAPEPAAAQVQVHAVTLFK